MNFWPRPLGAPLDRAFILLILATGLTWTLGEEGAAGTAIIVLILAIVFAKGRLVILDFMGLRHAPRLWRGLLEAWLIAVGALILLAYWISIR